MDNILKLRPNGPTVEDVIDSLDGSELETILVIAITNDNLHIAFGATCDKQKLSYMATRFQHKLHNGDYD